MATLGDALQGISDIYKSGVEEEDKKGLADIFKLATRILFKKIRREAQEHGQTFTPYHIYYGDGYFIFGRGTNSTIQFKVKECPGWLFGLWWSQPAPKTRQKDDGTEETFQPKYLNGSFFTQFEDTIDKFKPSRSNFCHDFTIIPNWKDEKHCVGGEYSIWKMLSFIHDEPDLAFCRDYHGWDYNEKYHTREEAHQEYEKYRNWDINQKKYSKLCNKRVLHFVTKYILPLYPHSKIVDYGENWSPRYDVMVPLNDDLQDIDSTGCYSWFNTPDERTPEENKISHKYDMLIKKCEQISDEYSFMWFSPFNQCIEVYDDHKTK